jgi:hypothetical protein
MLFAGATVTESHTHQPCIRPVQGPGMSVDNESVRFVRKNRGSSRREPEARPLVNHAALRNETDIGKRRLGGHFAFLRIRCGHYGRDHNESSNLRMKVANVRYFKITVQCSQPMHHAVGDLRYAEYHDTKNASRQIPYARRCLPRRAMASRHCIKQLQGHLEDL